MRETLDGMIQEKFDYESGKLEFSCPKMELTLRAGEKKDGSFRIQCNTRGICEGQVSSSDVRMECVTQEFHGNDTEILFCVHGENAEEGDVIKGSFYVISNQGEYYLPFVVVVEHTFPTSSQGEIKNLFLFANLAKTDWDEAVKLFYSPEFRKIFNGNDGHFLDSYRALSAYPQNQQNVEEFLIHINKKQKIEYSVSVPVIDISLKSRSETDTVIEREMEIARNGWGYTAINIECEGDFVFTEKAFLSDDDFLGSKCRLPIYIDPAVCHRGRNIGRIYLFNSYFSMEIPVSVYLGYAYEYRKMVTAHKRMLMEFMQSYLDYKLKRIKKNVWLKEAGKFAERAASMNDSDIEARLFQIHVLITEERYDEASWFMEHVEELFEREEETNPALRAYYWYLATFLHPEAKFIREAETNIRTIYQKNRDEWRVGWLLLYLSDDFAQDAEKSYAFLEKICERGCTSPVIYAEAVTLLNNNPALLRKLGNFEIRTIHFGVRNEAFGPEVTENFLGLCSKIKDFSEVVFKILVTLYGKNKDPRILREICALLIKGDRHGIRYLSWYREGARNQLRITNIYEYYLMSVDLNHMEPIPEPALIYFSYQPHLDYERSSYLYRYVYEKREQFPALYEKYVHIIYSFVLDQIKKGHLNKHLAFLYQELVSEEMIEGAVADELSRFAFAEWIEVSDPRVKKLYVYHHPVKEPVEYVLSNGGVWVELYGSNYRIALEDAYGNRFLDSIDYTREKLMLAGKFMGKLRSRRLNNIYFDLSVCENIKNQDITNEIMAEKGMGLAESGILDQAYMANLLYKLLVYYYDHDLLREVDRCIRMLKDLKVSMELRGKLLNYVIAMGKYDMAYEWIKEYGPYFVEPGTMIKLLDELMPRMDMEDEILSACAVYAFTNARYGSGVLRYLVHYYKGSCRQMRDIWKAAGSFEVDTYELAERLLVQMIYTGAFVGEKFEIFQSYVANGAKEDVEKAFLLHCAYDFFVKEQMTDGIVFEEMKRMYDRKEKLPRLCKLAFLKYYAENEKELTSRILPAVGEFLSEMIGEKIYLNFFRNFRMFGETLKWMEDRTIVEYRAHQGNKARIHFCMVRENEEDGEYYSEYMREVYGGVCFKDFILFFGEKMQYYITEETDGQEQLTESGTIRMSDNDAEISDSRFGMINDMVISKAMHDYDTLDGLLEEFFRREFYNGELFKLE